MKDQYFGDVNDFVKYGLLRQLQAHTGLRLGVAWYLTPSDGGPDGARRRYLTDPGTWRAFDPDLYDGLRRIGSDSVAQSVESASTLNLLPGARYFGQLVPGRRDRSEFLQNALTALDSTDLVFLDPDNGIEPSSLGPSSAQTAKYALWDELRAFYSVGSSLLVYQHFPRVPRDAFVAAQSGRIAERLGAAGITVFVTAHVGFFLICQQRHRSGLEDGARRVHEKWGDRIRVYMG
ncbi:MAG: hypothetical protein IPK85_05520 [Gemmatimonadetes bacterium]|nr:hypothetical protein [Gemmatimonadota bacterium]